LFIGREGDGEVCHGEHNCRGENKLQYGLTLNCTYAIVILVARVCDTPAGHPQPYTVRRAI
jgi:hypothetical protein